MEPDPDPADAGARDQGADGGLADTGVDGGTGDRGVDGALDAAPFDAEPFDAEPFDAEPFDAEPFDAEPTDAEPLDSEPLDAEPDDAADAGPSDADPLDGSPADLGVSTTSTSTWTVADGTPDTACTPWTLVDSATPEDPAVVGSALVITTSADAENVYYYQQEADLSLPGILRLEARIRLVSGNHSSPSRGPASLGFRLGPDLKKNMLQLRSGQAFLLADENVLGPSVSVATTDVPHDYVMTADLTTGAIEVFQDGVSILTGSTYQEPVAGAPRNIFFGEASLFANGSSEWYHVTHNAHSPTTCP
ncbi:MAG: hypothetical protein IPG45_14120 [Deltaproteobacteria bacterium]|nr:hypothetical protein [Deltaproteobacteria bacterium]